MTTKCVLSKDNNGEKVLIGIDRVVRVIVNQMCGMFEMAIINTGAAI